MIAKCAYCRSKIVIPNILKGKDWLHAKSSGDLDIALCHGDSFPELIFLVNSGFEKNAWLCGDCFREWSKLEKWKNWNKTWNKFVRGRYGEVVQFT